MLLDTIKTSIPTVITHVQDWINLAIGGRPSMYLYFGGIHPLKKQDSTHHLDVIDVTFFLYYSLYSFFMNKKAPVEKAVF